MVLSHWPTYGRCLMKNTMSDNRTDGDVTSEVLMRPNDTTPEGVTECACLCTSVSPACCPSTEGVVREPPSSKLDTVLDAPSNTTCCDSTTGKFRN